MGEIVIEPGDTKKIVSQPGTDEAYNIGVTNEEVYLSHSSSRTKSEGKLVRPGDRVTIDNLRGKSIYAKNPSDNTETASLNINLAAFNLSWGNRAIIGASLTSSGNEAAPANDDDVHRYDTGVDVNESEASETFEAPDAADSVVVSVDDADGSFGVVVEFLDSAGGSVVTSRDKSNNTDYSGDSTTDVLVTVDGIASPFINIRIVDESGAANTLDYSVYAR